MAKTATIPPLPADIADVMQACPKPATAHLNAIRALIFETAGELAEAGYIEESLKWGQPSYATFRPKSGTPIRLGWSATGDTISLFVHCQTSLMKDWRNHYSDTLNLIDNREIRLPVSSSLPREALKHCVAMALTYHVRKKTQ